MNRIQRTGPCSPSVVIPVRNEEATLGAQLDALSRQDFSGNWEVLIADNGSTDRSRQVALDWSSRLPGFQLLDASAVAGAAHARNVGWRAARGDLIAYCDGDDVVSPGWLSALVAASPRADLIGGRLTDTELNPAHLRFFDKGRFDQPLAYGIRLRVSSASMAIWRDVLEQLGGWDESFLRSEDLELSWRVQAAGFEVVLATEAVVAYRQEDNPRRIARHAFYSGKDNRRLLRRHRTKARDGRRKLKAVKRLPASLVESMRSRKERILLLRRTCFVIGWLWDASLHSLLTRSRNSWR